MSEEPKNIQAFNILALTVFQRLYDCFPEPEDIRGLRFVIEFVLDHGPDSEEAGFAHMLPHTRNWLREEGFIRWDNVTLDGNYNGVVFTLKALTILGYVPTSIEGSRGEATLIDRARQVLAKGVEGASSDAVKAIVGRAMSLAMDYVG